MTGSDVHRPGSLAGGLHAAAILPGLEVIMTVRPTLVFSHANGFPGGSYRTFLAPFAEHFDVHPLDRLGHDPAYPVDAGWESLSRQLEDFMAPLPKPLVGMGHSMGGVLTFLVAHRRPEWFRALVMLDPPLVNGWQGVLFNLARRLGQTDRITPAGLSQGRRAHWPDRDAVDSYFGRRGFFNRFDSRCLADYLDAGLEKDAGGWRLRYAPAVEVDVFRTTPGNTGRLAPLRGVPGLMVSGAESEPMFRHCALRHVRRHGMVYRLAPGGHMFPLEQPATASAIILEALLPMLEGTTDANTGGAAD